MRLVANPLVLVAPSIQLPTRSTSKVLMMSMRRIHTLVGACALYEFEDLLADLLGADMSVVTNTDGLHVGRNIYRGVRYLTGSPSIAEAVRPGLGAVPLQQSYDIFFPFFNHPHELYALNAIRGWRERTSFAACYLCEAWDADLPMYMVEMLHDFDHIFIGVRNSVETISRLVKRPVTYLPMGIDTDRFCPPPGQEPPRFIDVCSVGRRSEITHQALLQLAEQKGYFYHHDTFTMGGRTPISFRVANHHEHRGLLANLLKRSRYFMANRAWADRPYLTGGRDEVPARFYEGAAAGAVMIGAPPRAPEFDEQFGWADSVVPIEFNSPNIGAVIAELDKDPERVARARHNNIKNTLLKHDWVYRILDLLPVLNLPSNERIARRVERLQQRAAELG